MAKPELGIKRICAACNLKFYDLHKTPIVCPTCAAVFVVPVPPPARPARRPFARSTPATAAVPLVAERELADEAIVDDVEIDRPDALVAQEDKLGDEQEERVGDADDDAGIPVLQDMDEE